MPSDDRDPLDVLAEDFADRLRRGEHPSVADYADRHPDHAEQLRELLPAVAQMELLKRFRTPAAEKSLPDRLGDFRIVRELGRGGMGVVFEAVQESLGRPVALKVLARHAQLDPTRRERFVREAQAAAKLHHTNIVPVFGVGEHDGLPYYVMQLIPGCGLHALVRGWRADRGAGANPGSETVRLRPDTAPLSSPPATDGEPPAVGPGYGDWRFVAEVGLQAADALHYAHKHGVLHRDVKPANLIFDGERVWVADFGLAKLMTADGLTATGDIVGTLQYLPPESLSGAADPRSDVYGLGATLYELLTLEPPFTADSPAQLVKRVADEAPPLPRTHNRAIPRDLETIVLTAMARDPRARYASARALAEDLSAFLADRPIKARRASLLSRAWRACRRNPAVSSLALSTAAALVLAAVGGWVGFAREGDRRKEAEKATRAAEAAKLDADRATAEALQLSQRLEANLKLSLETFEKVFESAGGPGPGGFGPPFLRPGGGRGPEHRGFGPFGPGGPGGGGPPKDAPEGGPAGELAADKAAILEAVLSFYDRFVEQNPPTPRLQLEAAKASRRVCEANLWLKRPDKAAAAFNRSVALLEPLCERFPDDRAMRTELVLAYLAAPPGAHPDPRGRAAERAAGDSWLTGVVLLRSGLATEPGDRAAAEVAYARAVAAFTAPDAVRPPMGHLDVAAARYRLAWVQGEQGKWSTARAVLEKGAEELSAAVADRPGPGRELLAATYFALHDVCERLRDGPAAADAQRKGTQLTGMPFGGPGGAGARLPFGGGFGGPKKDGPGKKDGPPFKKN